MAGLTFTANQVFTGTATLGSADTGQVALTEVGNVAFTTDSPPAISLVTITKDDLASNVTYDGVSIESVTVTAVHTNSVVTLTAADLPKGVTVPADFTLPQTVMGTVLDVEVETSNAFITGNGQVGVVGYEGDLALLAVQNLELDGLKVNVGAAILSLGTQAVGTINDSFVPDFTSPCFAAGTRIATPAGEVLVEALRAGDEVSLADGGTAPVVWLGHRRVDCRRHPSPADVLPVRVAAGAFGPGLPVRDLLLSPDHALFLDDALIPVRYLLNGATVRQEKVAEVTYYHVELPRHAIVLAEGLPTESYLDTGNRRAFANGGGAVMAHPDFAADYALAVWRAQSCAPLALDGPKVAAARARLRDRAATLGWRRTEDAALDIVVDAEGAVVEHVGAEWLRVELPIAARTVRLRSRSFVPALTEPASGDWRRLGVAVGVALDGAALAAPCFAAGWHAPEAGSDWRWTDGAATLALPVLLAPAVLTIKLLAGGASYWLAPAPRLNDAA